MRKRKFFVKDKETEHYFIGKIEDLNRSENHKNFIFELNKFIEENDLNNYKEELLRIIFLIKASDVLIDCNGDFHNIELLNTLRLMRRKAKDIEVINSINTFLADIKLINKISKRLKPQTLNYIHIINKMNYYIYDQLEQIDEFERTSIQTNLNNIIELQHSIENLVETVSKCLAHLNLNEVNLTDLNKSIKGLNKNSLSFQSYQEIVNCWKYANASITRNRLSRKIVVNGINDFFRTFIANRTINLENRQLPSKIHQRLKLSKSEAIVAGLGEEIFSDLSSIRNEETFRSRLSKLKNQKIYNIRLIDLADFFVQLKKKYSFGNAPFVKFDGISSFELPYNDLMNLLNRLSFRYDLFDSPFIMIKGSYYVYIPAIKTIDPVHVLYCLLKNDKKWQDQRGESFEDEIYNSINNYTFAKSEGVGKKRNKLKFRRDGKEHEIDAIVIDDDNIPMVLECKTFSNAYSIRELRIELDKIYSKKYALKFKEHFDAVQKYNSKILTFCDKNLKSNRSFNHLMKQKFNWSGAYCLLVSNLIFPTEIIKDLQEKYNISVIFEFDFKKLVDHRSLYENKAFTAPDLNKIMLNKLLIDNDINLTQNNIKAISLSQPVKKMFYSRNSIKNVVIPEKLKAGLYKYKNIEYHYYL